MLLGIPMYMRLYNFFANEQNLILDDSIFNFSI